MNKFFIAMLCILFLTFAKAEQLCAQGPPISSSDSIALVELYHATDGPNWFDNTNWLTSAEVKTWFGISTEFDRVSRIELPSNNLKGYIPASINMLNELEVLIIFDNQIRDLPALTGLSILQELMVEDNALTFEDLEPNAPLSIPIFTYAPQREFDVERNLTKTAGSDVTWSTPAGGIQSTYRWSLNGTIIGAPLGDPNYTINNIMSSDGGTYVSSVTNSLLPGLTLTSMNQNLNIGPCEDDLGGEYKCQEMMIKFDVTASQLFKDSLLNAVGATRIDSCDCGNLELWELADTVNLEGTVKTSKKDPKVEESGLNYFVNLPFAPFFQGDPVPPGTFNPVFNTGNEVIVAIIDSGVQFDHPDLENYMWLNDAEYPPEGNFDDDANCLVDDFRGWDFLNGDEEPYDEHGHGTHIAGIVAADMNQDILIMNLQVFDASGASSLFKSACAIYYAANKGAKVINTSWGYYGQESLLLRNAIQYAGESCGALVVASAGNSGINVDSLTHYPSGHDLDNVISVAALSLDELSLASFSNHGDSTVDIAAVGTAINSTVPYDLFDSKSGTSMAAGEVSKAAALLFLEDPSATYRNVKSSILLKAKPLSGGTDSLKTGGYLATSDALTELTSSAYLGECSAVLDIKILLEGPFDSGTNEMNNPLWTGGSVPLTQPFNISPWFYEGTETIGSTGLALSGSDQFVDWVLLIIGDPDDEDNEPLYIAAMVQKDGDVTDINGDLIRVDTDGAGFVAIVHRNHLGIMSAEKVSFDIQPSQLNFASGSTPAFGSQAMKVIGGNQVIIAGDASRDGTVNVVDLNAHWRIQNGTPYIYGASTSDFNMDGSVNSVDLNSIWRINNSLISSCPLCY